MSCFKIRLISLCIFLSVVAFAQNPKREVRAAWIATVSNIDYPTNRNLSPAQQRAEFINILNNHQAAGINTVFVQIRTTCDAFYPSPFEPWSEFLTGKQGKAPEPMYDPLAFMIDECRRRAIEFHAWINPYRAVLNIQTAQLDTSHIAVKKPEWLLAQNNLRFLNPGLPEVRSYITQIIMDVVRRYDLDGIHFDDYFYPYPVSGVVINDSETFNNHNRGITNLNDWRRDNVDLLVKMVSDSIKSAKPWVKFGISPFGIWQNKSASQPLGSDTRGLQSYSDIYADSRKWLAQGWLDYLAPQLYWHIGFSAADFQVLTNWWSSNAASRHIYIGHGLYRLNVDTAAAWRSPTQLPEQLRLIRQTPHIAGSAFYNTTSINRNPLGFRDSLSNNFYKTIALRPTMIWKDNTPPTAPAGLTATLNGTQAQIRWAAAPNNINEMNRVRHYVLYRFENNTPLNLELSQNIRAIITSDSTSFTDTNLQPNTRYTYILTALDRLQNESGISNLATINVTTSVTEGVASVADFSAAPNPVADIANIRFVLTRPQKVRLAVYDMYGRLVAILDDGSYTEGEHTISYDVGALSTGIYVAVLSSEKARLSRKLVVQK